MRYGAFGTGYAGSTERQSFASVPSDVGSRVSDLIGNVGNQTLTTALICRCAGQVALRTGKQPARASRLRVSIVTNEPISIEVPLANHRGCERCHGPDQFYGFAAVGGLLILFAIVMFASAMSKASSWRAENADQEQDAH